MSVLAIIGIITVAYTMVAGALGPFFEEREDYFANTWDMPWQLPAVFWPISVLFYFCKRLATLPYRLTEKTIEKLEERKERKLLPRAKVVSK